MFVRALIGKTPAGKGRYADNGKWIRTQYIKVEPGNDGFGTEFLQNHANQSKFTCDICCITVTSQQQLDMHITGQKHKKKLSSINLNTEPSTTDLNITEGCKLNRCDLNSYNFCPECSTIDFLSRELKNLNKTYLAFQG